MHQSENIKKQINHYNKQRRVLMANSTVCQSKWKPIVEPRRAKPDISSSPPKSKRKVQGVPQSQTAALARPQEEDETDKSKQAQPEQTYEKH